jgi:ArsR family transcriptional regulator, arsenate/arsenite/antimonite-responsive transcriptional repressor
MIDSSSPEQHIHVQLPSQREELAHLCKALAHPVRVQILQFLATLDTACVCGDIVNILPLAQSTVSQHLKILKDAGLILGEIDGPRTCYYLNHEKLGSFKSLVMQL